MDHREGREMISGYMNKILSVDLSVGEIAGTPYPDEWKKKYIGGTGVAAKIIYDCVKNVYI
jgi:aldehyde:ferredoxin oxidoreductase